MSYAIETKGLTKSFFEYKKHSHHDFKLGPIDFRQQQGRIMGLVGPNGAGKTTFLHCLMGLLKLDNGEAFVNGELVNPMTGDWKQKIGFVSDSPTFYERWSCERNLNFISKFYPDWSDEEAKRLAHRFDLGLSKRVSELSRGNRVKLGLIIALSHFPKLFLFDEPTSGLDPIVRSEVMEVLHDRMVEGETSILYSTHITSDLSKMADELTFIAEGALLAQTTKDDLQDCWRQIHYRHSDNNFPVPGLVSAKHEGTEHIVVTNNRDEALRFLNYTGASVIAESKLSLDEIAIHILKGGHYAESHQS